MKKQKKKNLGKILVYFKDYKFIYILCFLIMLITDFGIVIYGGLIGDATQSLINKKIDNAVKLLILYFIIVIVNNLLNRFREYLSRKSQIKISRKIGYDTYNKAMKLPAYAYEEMSSGEIINRITNDTETIVGSIDELMDILAYVFAASVLLIYIYINSYLLGIEITIFLILFSFVTGYFQKKLKTIKKDKKKVIDEYTSLTNESIRGYREIKTLGIIKNIQNDVSSIIKSLLNKSIKENNIIVISNLVSQIFRGMLEVGVFLTCAILIGKDKLSISFFIAMTYYIYQYTYIIQAVTDFGKRYQELDVSMSRINEILFNEKYEDVKYGNKSLDNIKGVIKFNNVSFSYPNEKEILNNFNITFEPNKKIAIVGSSGEGKSTLFNLITRLFDPTSGTITLDDVDIKDLTEESLRKSISIIRQEPFIFNRTILENFKLIDPKVTLKEVKKYCKMACIDEYIESLPKKYDTILGEGGVNLSGGQKQRLSIARTLLKKSKVILFDEATSALDNESQRYIKDSIDTLAHDHTVLIVAHRLSTIVDADIIYVIKNGEVFDHGTHEYLMKNCEFYQNLYTTEDKAIK